MINRKHRLWWRANKKYFAALCFWISGFLMGWVFFHCRPEPKLISPCPDNGCFIEQKDEKVQKIEATTAPKPRQAPTNGKASYYSVSGCLGCRDDRVMANGERLDDTRATVAYNHLPLNTPVKITNTVNGKTITVPVTDRGGFERHGKIADLSLAAKELLNCGDVCNITIDF